MEDEGWFIITNLPTLEEALDAYKARTGIEAMFKDCKTGGYNLQGSQASPRRLSSLVLLIAIAYTSAVLSGAKVKRMGYQKYVGRLSQISRTQRRHSNFWVGLYGQMWLPGMKFCWRWVEQLLALSPSHKLRYHKGLVAMSYIQQTT